MRGYLSGERSHIPAREAMEKENEGRRRCLECGDPLPYGRADMKYCSVRCKSRYNYVRNAGAKGARVKIMNALDRNYGILDHLVRTGVSWMEIPDLVQLGFDVDCFTSYHKFRNRSEYRCFDIKYNKSQHRVYGIARVQLKPLPPGRRCPRHGG
ncbi:MAG: hypothetical protein II029_01680 [Bacteroidales bacterium]|nr:hypothetical protein [Bacteroidales bacterium]